MVGKMIVDDQGKTHARLSASASKRWMNCAGSVRLIEEGLPLSSRQKSSPAAAKGTCAHSVLELCLQKDRMADAYHGAIFNDVTVDQSIVDGVNLCLDYVRGRHQALGGELVMLMLEEQLDMTWLDPDMGGTNDIALDAWPDVLEVIDYKNGYTPVPVLQNPQTRYYALGRAKQTKFSHKRVRCTIVQPNRPFDDDPIPGIRWEELSMDELRAWGEELKQAGKNVRKANAPLNAGDWCTFCPAGEAGICPAFRDKAQNIAKADFDDEPHELPVEVDVEQLARDAAWIPFLDNWCKQTKQNLDRAILGGAKHPDFKIVAGKSSRAIATGKEMDLIEHLRAMGVETAEAFTKPEIKSPAQLEKTFGKEVKRLLADTKLGLVHKAPGKPTVAKATDTRPAIEYDPASDFPDDLDGDTE